MRHEYTPEDIAYIKAHYKQDKTAKQIAAHIGVEEQSVKNWVYNQRLKGIKVAEVARRIGTVRDCKRADGTSFQRRKVAKGKWEYVKVGRKLADKPQKEAEPCQPTGKEEKRAARPMPVARIPKGPVRRSGPDEKKTVCRTDRNPEVVKILSDRDKIEQGWRYVQIDNRTRVLRHPSKIAS